MQTAQNNTDAHVALGVLPSVKLSIHQLFAFGLSIYLFVSCLSEFLPMKDHDKSLGLCISAKQKTTTTQKSCDRTCDNNDLEEKEDTCY